MATAITTMQRYFLEALGRNGRKAFPCSRLRDVDPRLEACWYASGLAGRCEWRQARSIAIRSWRVSTPSRVFAIALGRVARDHHPAMSWDELQPTLVDAWHASASGGHTPWIRVRDLAHSGWARI
ncbi:hypothetical protein [Lysobacter auxotrophicus]|uniref:Uncharacterized protein n=1 Tax=Lysobacter auxotrophicus TaxID=2992573 RepID=A0ABM8D9I2_9GAMM|nr:hypothetical protein [Lysobacter auxotrophicus]BDU15194.1 hypothetical protein LA521A_03950 [Lysobacter auxotrophicus]